MPPASAQPPPLHGPSMRAFWDSVLRPLIEALQPERILEIGADQGTTTRVLLEQAAPHGAVVYAIDPKPNFDPAELEAEFPDLLVFHRALSLEVLPRLERFDFALIDGDHNWHTVLSELRLLERRALEEDGRPPVVALHDVGWPYGRRDLYYDPDNIPADKRRPHAHRAIHPDSDELVDEGINAHLANAKLPAARHSGVRGAVDDFVEESGERWKLFEVPGQHGLGVLALEQTLSENERARELLEATGGGEFLRAQVEAVERDRIEAEIRRRKATRGAESARAELDGARKDSVEAARKLDEAGDRLDEAEREVKRLARKRDLAEVREGELEDELIRERRRARLAAEEIEAAGERRAARISELESELAKARAEIAAEVAKARTRLIADFEDERASLERALDDARAQAGTGYHAAAELREMLEERELELQRLAAQLTDLQAALGRTRADAEVAEAERSALDRRLGGLAAVHESTLGELAERASSPMSEIPAVAEKPPAASPAEVTTAVPYSEIELEVLERFTAAYRPPAFAAADPLALPSPRDRRGALRTADSSAEPSRASVDVVVCVHNALEDVRRCLWSLVHKASYPFRLIVVNDGSGAETTAYLEEAAAANPEMTLVDNASPPHGYTIAANLGMRAAAGDYVVVLNSDTVVTHGWLEKIVACGESDERIGILGPLSNAASHQSLPELRDGGAWATNPLPDFVTEDGVARLLERVSPRARPRLPFVNGFCYVVKRAVFDAIGYFDEENFASGYCEENDFSYRAAQAGFELAVSDDCYVFHAKSKSFTAEVRAPIAKRNYAIFLRKHGPEKIRSRVRDLEEDTSLEPLRGAVAEALSSPGALASALGAAAHDPLEVAFILPGLSVGGSGGSHSIYQEVCGLRKLGMPARILLPERAWERAKAAYTDADEVFETFADLDQLSARTADADVISATHFKSAAMLAHLHSRRQDFLPAYYVQDYEPFFTPTDSDDVREAIQSYEAVPDCLLFAKTHWLCNIVGDRHGLHVAKVEPSIDEGLFLPGGESGRGDGPLRLVAMIRPRTPRRQPAATIAVLEALKRRLGEEVELVTFGCHADEVAALSGSGELLAYHQGVLTRQQVAALLGRSDVFLDLSMYQAFGRTALEAMACGATAVVPRLGGVWEFVEEGVNALAVDTLEPAAAIEAVSQLARDRDRLRGLQAAARRTAVRYSIGRAALSEYLLFSHEHARRFGTDRAAA